MPNKYYLRSDRMAVNADEKELERIFYQKEPVRVTAAEDYLQSLPGLQVEPSFLATLKPGQWFEGVEMYEVCVDGSEWWKCGKYGYDKWDGEKRILIIAPQEAEKGQEGANDWSYEYGWLKDFTGTVNEKEWGEGLSMEQVEAVLLTINYKPSPQPVTGEAGMQWVKASERLPQAGKPFFIRSVHTKSGGMMWGEEIGKMEELENIEWLDEQAASRPTDAVDRDKGWVSVETVIAFQNFVGSLNKSGFPRNKDGSMMNTWELYYYFQTHDRKDAFIKHAKDIAPTPPTK